MAVADAWRSLAARRCWTFDEGFILLSQTMDKMLLRSMLVGGGSNGVPLGAVDGEIVHCICCAEADEDGHLSWE